MSQETQEYKATVRHTNGGVPTALCAECHIPFTQTRGNQKFCSEKCRTDNWAKTNRPKAKEENFLLISEDAKAAALVAVSVLPVGAVPWKVAITKYKANRSIEQNNRYFAILTEISNQTGNDVDDLHELCKKKFLGIDRIEIMNEVIERPKSTAKLDTLEFSEYCQRVEAWAATEAGVML